MLPLRNYEMTILLTNEFNETEAKSWIINYSKKLRKLNAQNFFITPLKVKKLAYKIKRKYKGNYLLLNFASLPKYIKNFSKKLKMDSKVLRFLIYATN